MKPTRTKTFAIICRLTLGAIFLTYGLDGYYHFLPLAEPSPEGAEFLNAMKNTGYFFYFLKGLETLCGALLVANFFVPTALIILTPIIVNILLYNIFLDPQSILIPLIILGCASYLYWYFRDLFKVFLKYQYYTSPDTEGKAKIVVLSENERLLDHFNQDKRSSKREQKKEKEDRGQTGHLPRPT